MQKLVTPTLTLPLTWYRRTVPALATAALMLMAPVATAQGLFSAAIRINDEVVTQFELEQRVLFMSLLRLPGDPDTVAREILIEERLKQQVMREAGIVVPPEDVDAAVADLAGRTRLSAEEFVNALAENGVAAETLRDYVRVGLGWRVYIARKYLDLARPTEAEINRAMSQGGQGGIRVLLSEVIMPVNDENAEQVDALAQEISQLTTFEAFSAAAAQYSATETRDNGGKLDWLALSTLPPALQAAILDLKPGEITTPIALPNAIALFQMRGIGEAAAGTPRYATIDYAAYYIAGGRSPEALAAAQQVRARVDICDDLFTVARGQPPQVLERENLAPGQIPRDIAIELAKLDPGEVSTALTRNNGQTLVFLMLCGRTVEMGKEVTRQDVANALAEQRLNFFSESHLQQLMAEARIAEE
jgi:peptidyl-prolyl cis-trans isomerase SurA